jgi:uncharacterized protein
MQLVQEHPGSAHYVRRCAADRIVVGEREHTTSFLLGIDRVVEHWPVGEIDALDTSAIDAILALDPALVLLGTGAQLRFPAQSVLAAFLGRGIGVEVMDNAAAARTFNVLAAEGRRVVAAFVLPARGG